MPYDPRMLQMAQMGIGMMAPQSFDPNAPRQKQWWDQPMPRRQQPDDDRSPNSPNSPKQPPPSLLQMLMLGGKPTYSGTPRPGAASDNPWGWP